MALGGWIFCQTTLPVGYWTFDDGAVTTDRSGNEFHFNAFTPASLARRRAGGQVGSFLKVMNTVDPTSSHPGMRAFEDSIYLSMECMVRYGTPGAPEGLIMVYQNRAFLYLMEDRFEGRIYYDDGTYQDLKTPLTGIDRLSSGYYYDERWHHIVFTIDACARIAKIYVDGVCPVELQYHLPGKKLRRTSTASTPSFACTTAEPSLRYMADLDEVALYDTVLTRHLVAQHYHNMLDSLHYNFTPAISYSLVLGSPSLIPPTGSTGDVSEYPPGFPAPVLTSLQIQSSFQGPRFRDGHDLPVLRP